MNSAVVQNHTEPHSTVGGLLKEAVFGFNDGVVSTFAVVAGLTGGLVEPKTVLLAALATLVAGAFSMGLGTYLGAKSEKELYESERKRELWEMDNKPEVEKQEIRDIYAARGFKGKLLEEVVHQISSNRKVWLDVMMQEELGFSDKPPNPIKHGITMSVAFVVGSFIPTLPYLFPADSHFFCLTEPCASLSTITRFGVPLVFILALGLSILGLLFAGGFKTRFTQRHPVLSALETLLVGAAAAGGSYWVGTIFG